MKRTYFAAAALALAAAFAAGPIATVAHAQEAVGAGPLTGTLKKVKSTGTVTIGFRDASVPFSYLGPGRKPIGYSIDICLALVGAIQNELGVDNIGVRYLPVNPQTRMAMVADGAVDLECGQTTNNTERQKQVAFSPIIFVSGTKLLVKRTAKWQSYRDLRGRTIAVVEGTTNEAAVKALNAKEALDYKLMPVRENDQAFQAVADGKADAWAGDDVVLTATIVESKSPRDFYVMGDFLSYDPYGIMYRRDDPAFANLVRQTFEDLAESRELARIYDQWFQLKLPSGKTLGITMSPQLESIFEALGQPTE
jgi:ABC-type amino acid transport substrate-binding protein